MPERLVKRLVARELTLSFVPDAEERLWRTVTRKKYQLRCDRVRLQNQLESLLEEAHIKLSSPTLLCNQVALSLFPRFTFVGSAVTRWAERTESYECPDTLLICTRFGRCRSGWGTNPGCINPTASRLSASRASATCRA